MISERRLLRTHRKIYDMCSETIEQSRNLVFRYYGLVPYSETAEVAAQNIMDWEIPIDKDHKMTETQVIAFLREAAREDRKYRRMEKKKEKEGEE